jgi:hypothetical protein
MRGNKMEYLLKNIEDKLDFLNRLEETGEFDENDLENLQVLATNADNEIRNRLAQVLANCQCTLSEKILMQLLEDEDVLVRANACDSLYFSTSIQTIDTLKHYIISDKYLVRGYAVLSIADIAINTGLHKDIAAFLEVKIKTERSVWVRICYYRSLCILGYEDYYNNILSELSNKYYKNRLCALNAVGELVNLKKQQKTRLALENRLILETAYSVKNKIQKILAEIIRESVQ